MDKFLKEYNGHRFEDWGCHCSNDYKSFVRKFKAYLKRNLPSDCELIGFKPNHYDHSGFIKHGDEYIYVSWSWDRYSPVDIDVEGAHKGVLCRFAKNDKDFRGETNQFTSLRKLPDYLVDMFVGRCGA